MVDLARQVLGVVVACAMAVACFAFAYASACRLLASQATRVRWCGAAIIGYWTQIALFQMLGLAGLFRPSSALVAWVALAMLSRLGVEGPVSLREQLRRDLSHAQRALAGALRSPVGVVLLGGGAIVAARTFRGLVAPPLVWDALTYHLFKAGRWVGTGSFSIEPAPNAWGFYEYYLPGGDILWAWAMLPTASDAFVAVANLAVWASCLLGVYAVARELGAETKDAVLASLGVGFTPAVANFLTASHVENFSLALFALGAVFVVRLLRRKDAGSAVLAAASLGLAAGVKFSNAPVVAVGLAVVLAVVVVRPREGVARSKLALACALAGAVAAPFYLRAWANTGSPTYPFAVTLFGRTLAAGDASLTTLLAAASPVEGSAVVHLLRRLFVPTAADLAGFGQFMNLGPGALLVLVVSVPGAAKLLARRESRSAVAYLWVSAAVAACGLASRAVASYTTAFAGVVGRFVMVPVAVGAVLASVASSRFARAALFAAVLVNLALCLPLGWGRPDLEALIRVSALLVPAIGLVGLSFLLLRREARTAGIAVGLAAAMLLPLGIERIRAGLRYAYYEHAARGEIFELAESDLRRAKGRFEPLLLGWPAWAYLDQSSPLHVAVAAGWEGMSPLGARYPYLGSRLQNRVSYVPVSANGVVSALAQDYRSLERADFDAWLRRLVDRGVDYVVLLPPGSIEGTWIAQHGELFSQVTGQGTTALVYRVERERAAQTLAAGGGRPIAAPP